MKPQDHSQNVQFSTYCIYSMANSKLITTVVIDRDCAQGSVSDSQPHCYKPQLCCEGLWYIQYILYLPVSKGAFHFQMRFFCGCINQIVLSNSRLPPWYFQAIANNSQTVKTHSSSVRCPSSNRQAEHRSMLDVNKAELNILPSDSLVNRCLVYIGEV